jgi:hypothetical protein
MSRILSLLPRPPQRVNARLLDCVYRGSNHDVAGNDAIEDTVWKTLEKSAANILSNHWETFWIFGDRFDHFVDGFEEFRS